MKADSRYYVRWLDDRLRAGILDYLRERCFVDAETGCWHWRLSVGKKGKRPICTISWLGKNGSQPHRIAYAASRAKRLKPGQVLTVPRCGCFDCIAPAHQIVIDKRQVPVEAAKAGRTSSGPLHVLKLTRAARRRRSTILTEEKVAAIRSRYAEIGNALAVSREFGISHSHCLRVAKGESWPTLTGIGALVAQSMSSGRSNPTPKGGTSIAHCVGYTPLEGEATIDRQTSRGWNASRKGNG